MTFRSLCAAFVVLCGSVASLSAQAPAPPKPPMVNDSALRIELVATYPDVEACTTVCGAPDGSVYVGNDPRDGRLNTNQPVNPIIRFGPGVNGQKRKRTVFADKLYSPAGSAWRDGWLYVIHDPLFTRFKDTDNDGVADVREDLVTNLGIMPNEGLNDHVVSGFTLGMDGYFYISVGDRGIFQAKSTKDGSTISMQGGGIARCRTDGTRLEVFSTGTRNHLQVNLDAEDNAFTRDNTDDGNGWWTRLTHHIEGGYYGYPYDYQRAPNYGVTQPSQQTIDAMKRNGHSNLAMEFDPPPVPAKFNAAGGPIPVSDPTGPILKCNDRFLPAMTDFGGGSPTGGLCYLSDGLPEQYRGKHFFSEWGKAGIFVTEVARDGATFKFVSDTKLVESDKGGDFRPMQISVAADGSVLIADWGYGGWKSPRVAGAIWRLYWPEAKPASRLKDESKATVDELIAALGHPDRDQRLRAQWALTTRLLADENVEESVLFRRIADVSLARVQGFLTRIHAAWAFQNYFDERPAVLSLLNHVLKPAEKMRAGLVADPDAAVRAQEVRGDATNLLVLLPEDHSKPSVMEDPDARVRLQATIAFGKASQVSNVEEELPRLFRRLDDKDRSVRFAAIQTLRELNENFLSRGGFWRLFESALPRVSPTSRAAIWRSFESITTEDGIDVLKRLGASTDRETRLRAVTVLGRVAYQPAPYGGHWWGTQPVKSPPPLNSIAWEGTVKALVVLTEALSDSNVTVRLEAAKAFRSFTIQNPAAKSSGLVGDGARVDPTHSAGQEALQALRIRLTAETDPGVRRQLIESLGVQKDPKAMDVFRQIALDEKADAEFRDTAIGAVVNIGGDTAKQTIAQLAAASLSLGATRKIIEAAGALKVLDAAPALVVRLKDENAGNREAAAKSLQQLGPKSNAGPALIEALADKDGKVQAAAIDALGSFREKAALPALIALAEKKKTMKETIGALANMPDESAIPVLVETLRDKNTGVRRNAIKALKAMREKARPQVEALLASGRVPEELVPEIRNAFDSGAITKWKMIGVFENVWDAVHPPERDANVGGSSQGNYILDEPAQSTLLFAP